MSEMSEALAAVIPSDIVTMIWNQPCHNFDMDNLRERKLARHELIAAFAAEHAGTALDLNPELEAASIEHLIATSESPP